MNAAADALEKFVEAHESDRFWMGVVTPTIVYLIGHFILWAYFGFPVAGR